MGVENEKIGYLTRNAKKITGQNDNTENDFGDFMDLLSKKSGKSRQPSSQSKSTVRRTYDAGDSL